MGEKNEVIKGEIRDLVDNFEKVLMTYINENYRSFTEKDIQKLVHNELKVVI